VYRDDRGPIQLGERLGQGGQGTVYALGSEAVKIYNATPSADQTQKIRALLTVRTATLDAISAWPNRLVYAGKVPIGYVMPKIADQHPVGRVSLPASRKVEFPEKPWGWLVHIARNLAAAVDQIHSAGVIVGDLNDANISVADTGVVRVLDVDSFQISLNGRSWNTGVGVPMYLPPELQGRDLTTIPRTKHHDTFGLAVIIFQLLMMGRHPWGGDYKSDKAIDELIATEPYAYGPAARARGLTPPASAPKMEWLHSDVAASFERAFSLTARPSAGEWAIALDAFRNTLTRCTVARTHQFIPAAGNCPWCTLEKEHGIFYFLPSGPAHRPAASASFVIAKLEEELRRIPLPDNFYRSNPKSSAVSPAPTPTFVNGYVMSTRLLGLALIALTIAGTARYAIGGLITGMVVFWLIYGNLKPGAMASRNRQQAEKELATLQETYDELISQWHASGSSVIIENHESATRDIRKYKSLGQLELQELQKLQQQHREIMLDLHLTKYLIRDADIGLPRFAVRSLEAYGIQTAAEIRILDTMKIPQIAAGRLKKLRNWRRDVIDRFTYDVHAKLPNYMAEDVKARYEQQRRDLEAQIPQQIERIKIAVNRWNEHKATTEAPIRNQAARILRQRAIVSMWNTIPNF
jgi:DNA-binding helix-hairpin-helix protein with protein kinase domain